MKLTKQPKSPQSRCLACGTARSLRTLIVKKGGKFEEYRLCTHHLTPIANVLRNAGYADATFAEDWS